MEKNNNKYPIRLDNPRAWRTYIGGRLIDEIHGIPDGKDGHFPEEWIMSLVSARNPGREDILDEGMNHLYGTDETLKDLLEQDQKHYLGIDFKDGNVSLGVLAKLIDSAERLTLQVHPDKETAMRLFNSPYGKTECWHILGGREVDGQRPCIYLGFKPGVTRESWKKLFDCQDIPGMLDCMQRYEVKVGDTVLIRGGMPHAIGAGCFLVEIQEPTDFTIRVERTTPSGFSVDDRMCHQGLGFEKMFDVFDYSSKKREDIKESFFIKAKTIQENECGHIRNLIGYDSTPLFKLNEITVMEDMQVDSPDCYSGIYVLEGSGQIEVNGRVESIEKGSQYFNPAGMGDFRLKALADKPLVILHFFGPESEESAKTEI